jgi:hypothetical protein
MLRTGLAETTGQGYLMRHQLFTAGGAFVIMIAEDRRPRQIPFYDRRDRVRP